MASTRDIIQKRFAGLGIHNAKVLISGARQITVDFSIPQGEDPEALEAAVSKTGLLELVDMGSEHPVEGTVIQTDYWSAGAGPTGIVTLTTSSSTTPTPETTPAAASAPAPVIYHTVMTGVSIASVNVEAGSSVGATGYLIAFTLKSDAITSFADYTGSHIGQTLAIVLDKKIISAPIINSRIDKGLGYIEGNFTADSANTLAIQLAYGALPIPLKVLDTKVVSP